MASITKTESSTYSVRYRTPTGKQRRRTFQRRTEAQRFAREVEIAKELTELQGAIKRHSRDINHLSAYLNQIASGGSFTGKPLAPIPAREKENDA